MSGFVDAVTFLTRVPARAQIREPAALTRAVPWFPIVGALVGALIAVVYAGAGSVLPPLPAAVLAIAVGTIVTGAFHEDGLADVADAFAGGYTRERRLEILKDPRHGTFGVLAIVLALVMRVGALASLDAWAAIVLLPGAHALSRAPAIALMRRPAATPGGLGAGYGGELTAVGAVAGIGAGVAIGAVCLGFWVLPAGVISALVAVGMDALARRKVGGIGGDVLGATQQVAEIAVLLVGVAVLNEGWGAIPWWRA